MKPWWGCSRLRVEGGGTGGARGAEPSSREMLAPFLASVELSRTSPPKWRAVPRDRGAAPLHQPHHRLPARRPLRHRSRLPDPGLEPQAGDRHPGRAARRGGRPAGLRGADPPARRAAPGRVRPGLRDRARSSRRNSRSRRAASTRSFRITKIPMRLDGDEISHVITIGEDVTEWRRIQAPASCRARSSPRSASSPPASCTRSTIRSPPSAPASRPSRAAPGS